MDMIPEEIKGINQWTYSFSQQELKRPKHTHYRHDGALSIHEAKRLADDGRFIGFYVTSKDPYILGDIDNVDNPENPFEELPVALANLLRTKKTYYEISPSGKGIRFILKLPSASVKDKVEGHIFYITEGMGDKRNAQINLGSPWQTITGNATPFSHDVVDEITLEELGEVFTLKFPEDKTKPDSISPLELPSISEISAALGAIPLDQNPRVKRAFERVFNANYQHYDFWIKVLMALHNYATLSGQMIDVLQQAIKWSAQDKEAFTGEEDVIKHWDSFNNVRESDIVSYKTLFGIAYKCILKWPVPKKQSKEEREQGFKLKPVVTEYANFEAMIKYYDISLYRDETSVHIFYVSGDKDILNRFLTMHQVSVHYNIYYGPFSKDTLIPTFHIMAQKLGFTGVSHNVITGFIKNLTAQTRKTINLIKMYFDTPHDKLPVAYQSDPITRGDTSFEKLFSCLRIDYMTPDHELEFELYKAYYKKWLMGILRNLYYSDYQQMNNCVMLLTGKEQIRKTSHFKYLLPPFMRDKVAFTTHGFATETSMRDVAKLSSTNLIIVWDELEQYLVQGTESNFKKIIDGNPQKIIDKYEILEKIVQPIAVYGATSNLREFRLGAEGSRRIFHIPVSWVDTGKMQTICWHKLFRILKGEMEWLLKTDVVPWLLTEEQLGWQRNLHTKIRSKTNLDMMLEEVFDFEHKFVAVKGQAIPGITSLQRDTSGRLMTTNEVVKQLERCGFKTDNIKRNAVVKTLERKCGEYTNTMNRTVQFVRPLCSVYRGLATQNQYKKWIMPPLRQEVQDGGYSPFRDYA